MASVAGAISAYLTGVQAALAGKLGADGQPVLVTLGDPGQFQPFACVAVATAGRAPIQRPTMGTNRSRETPFELDSIISYYVPGDETAQAAANQGALDELAAIETWVRTSPNEKLGGNARDSFLSGFTFDPLVATQAMDDPNVPPVAVGRIAQLTFTLTAYIRY